MRQAPGPGPSDTPPYGSPPPSGQWPPYGVPPPPGAAGATAQQRRGCRGCFLACLTVLLACGLLAVVVVAATVYMMREAFPKAATTRGLVTCAGLRILVNNEELVFERGNATPAQKAEIHRGFQELRARYGRECAPGR